MNKLREAAQQALDHGSFPQGSGILQALREALAQPEPEPVAWMYEYTNPLRERGLGFYETSDHEVVSIPLYAAPPQRQPLTEVEIEDLGPLSFTWRDMVEFARSIEKFHGIGGQP